MLRGGIPPRFAARRCSPPSLASGAWYTRASPCARRGGGHEHGAERGPDIDNESLYAACRQEGSDAQSDAFGELWAHLYRIAYGMLHERPDGDALAAECTQKALIKIHRSLGACASPGAFRSWAAQVLRRVVIDELRRPEHRRRAALPEDEERSALLADAGAQVDTSDLLALLLYALEHGPLSERSRRVVRGRYFEERPDEALAQAESQLSGQAVLPSHIQVTRAKNLASLRKDAGLIARLRELTED